MYNTTYEYKTCSQVSSEVANRLSLHLSGDVSVHRRLEHAHVADHTGISVYRGFDILSIGQIHFQEMNWYIESIGLLAGIIGLTSWIPQLYTVLYTKKHSGINLWTLYMISMALMLWFVYGYMRHAPAVMISNGCSLTAITCIIARVKWLRRHD